MAAAAPNQAPGSSVALGIRLNNPLNIRYSANNDWVGQVGSDAGFSEFDNIGSGFRAADKLLGNYKDLYGVSTLAGAVNKWAPPNENDTATYIKQVAQWSGISPDENIDLADPRIRRALLSAMTRKETGQIVSPDEILGHLNSVSGGQAPPPTQPVPTYQAPARSYRQQRRQETPDFWAQMGAQIQPDSTGGLGELGAGITPDLSGPTPTVDLSRTFALGAESGIRGAAADLNYFSALLNTLQGDADSAAENIRVARVEEEQASNALAGMESFSEFVDNPTFSGFFQQVVSGVGQITPMALSSIGTAMTGAVVQAGGKALLSAGGKSAAKKIIEDTLQKKALNQPLTRAETELLDQAYATLKKNSKLNVNAGLATGAFVSEYPMAAGSSFAEFGEAGLDMDADRAFQSLMIGAPVAAIGVAGEGLMLKAMKDVATQRAARTPSGSVMREFASRLGTALGRSASTEGITETIQEGIGITQRLSTDPTYTAEEAYMRLGQAAFMGFFGGGAFGGAAGTPAAAFGAANAVFERAEAQLRQAQEQRTANQIDAEQTGVGPENVGGMSTAESPADLAAQFQTAFNPDSGKHAAWVSGVNTLEIDPNEVVGLEDANGQSQGFAVFIEGKGTLLTPHENIAKEVLMSNASEDSLSLALGFSSTKPIDADRVVRVRDKDGNVISEEMTNAGGESAAIEAANRIAPDSSYTIDTLSIPQALADRQARRGTTRNMASDVDVVDANEQEGSFTTEAQERELSEGFNELDELPVEDVADFAVTTPDRRTDAANFENNWADILSLVPSQERAKVAALEPLSSESFAKTLLAYLKNDPGYYSVEQRGDRLFITRAPDSIDALLSGATSSQIAEQRVNARIQELLNSIEMTTTSDSRANRAYFFRGQQILRPYPTKDKPKKDGEQFRDKVLGDVFTVENPDGSTNPIGINAVIAAGRDLNIGSEDALLGENLTPAQSTRAGLLRGLSVLAERGYKVSFFGKPVNFSQGVINRRSKQPDLFNTNKELIALERQQTAALADPRWATDLDGYEQSFFNDGIIFQSGGKQFSLRDLLQNTPDPIPLESRVADEKARLVPEEARKRVDEKLDRNPGLLDRVSYGQLLDEELERDKNRELGFTPETIVPRATTEPVVGFQAQSQSLTPAADALKRVAQWRQDELQRQREAMNAGTRSVVTPAELDAEIDAQLPAKQQEFLAEAEARVVQTPQGINPATGRPFTQSGTTVGGSVEVVDEIRERQIQAARAAGVMDADQGVDLQMRNREAVDSQGGRLGRDVELGQPLTLEEVQQRRTEQRLARERGLSTLPPDEVARRRQAMDEEPTENDTMTLTDLVLTYAPAMGGSTEVQANAEGTVRNRPIKKVEDINFLKARTPPSEAEIRAGSNVVGDIGGAATRVFGEAFRVFRQQIRMPVSVYTQTAFLEENLQAIKNEFDSGRINAETRAELEAQISRELPMGYGSVITRDNRYIIILQDSFSDGDVDGIEQRMAAVLGHEFGHIVFDQEIKRLADNGGKLFDMLMDAYKKDALQKDVLQYEGKGGFEEWYADQIASYLYDSQKKAKDGQGSYFKRLAAKFREFFQAVNRFMDGRLSADREFRAYVRDFVASNLTNINLYRNLTEDGHLDAVDKAVIRNWNGKISEQVPDKAIEAAQRMSKRMLTSGSYGFLKKYLTANDNWLRGLGPAGVQLGQFFYGKSQSTEKSGFHHDKQRVENQFVQKLATAMGVNPNRVMDWDTPELNEVLQQAEDETIDTADLTDPRAKAVRAVFEEFHATYLQDEKGRPYFQVRRRKNYAPRLINFHGLEESADMREQLAQLLVKYPNTSKGDQFGNFDVTIEEAREIVKQILADPSENPDVAQNSQELPNQDQEDEGHIRPGFRNALARSLGAIPTTELRGIGALAPPVLAFTQYFHHATRRVEFEKRGGEAEIQRLIDGLPEDQREYAKQAIMAQLGRVGIGMKPWVRTLNSVDAVWTSTTTLLFTAFTSFTDLAGPIIRSKDFAGMSRAFAEIQRTLTTDENQALTRAVGSAAAEAASNIFMAAGELDYANSTARRVLDVFFRYTGLQWYTRFSREFAAGMGREFLLDIANRDQNDTTQRWLDELAITREQILAWDSGNGSFDTPEGQAVAKAIAKFVDESIVRPNAAERPVWASHPIAMVVWRLKSYFYSFGKTVLGGMGREFKNRYREDGDFRGGGMVLALAMGTMLPLAAFGMEMKELTKWMLQALMPGVEATGRTFRSDHMSSPEYLATLVEKSGALGPWSIPLSIIQSAQWGDNPIVSQVPIVDLADATLLEGNWNRPIPVLNNID